MKEILFEQNPNPMLIYKTDTFKILDVNQRACEKYGYTKNEFLELTIKEIRPKKDIPDLMRAIDYLSATGQDTSKTHRHKKKNGELFYIQITSQPVDDLYKNARLVIVHDVSERVEAEQNAKRAFEELNHHITNSPLALVKWDNEFRIQEWSQRAEEIFGYAGEEVIGKSAFGFQFFGSDQVAKVKNNIRILIKGSQARNQFETTILHKSGRQIYIKVHCSTMRDDSGKVLSVFTLIEDISKQKQLQDWFQTLFEASNDALFIMKDEVIVDCNEEAARMFETSKEQLKGDSVIDNSPFVQPDKGDSQKRAAKIIEQALEGKPQRFEWRLRTAAGKPIDVEVSITRVTFNGEYYLLSQLRDITEKKSIRAEIRKREILFRNLFLRSPAALVMVDKKNKVLMINEGFSSLFGYSEEELTGKDIDKMIVPDEKYDEAPKIQAVDYTFELFNREAVRYTKQGTKKHVLITGIPVHIDREPYAGFGMYIDITDRKQYEEQLKESVKENKVLLAEIHHRVKNNLAIVSGILQLQEFESEDCKTKAVLNDSQLRIKSIALIHEMLYQAKSFSSISFGCYIHQLVDRIKETLDSDSSNIKMEVDVENISININQAVPCALLLNELLTNAYKHAFEDRENGKISISIRESGNMISVRITDNGVGLPEGFKQNQNASLGMNLIETLAKQIEAELKYEDSNGTTVTFSFEKKALVGPSSHHLN